MDGEGEEAQSRADCEHPPGDRSGKREWENAAVACREAGITEQTFYRWRKEDGGLKTDQARRLKELEQENVKLKRLVAELSLDKQTLQDITRGNV